MPNKDPLETKNVTIQSICNKIGRFAEHLSKFQSGSVSGFSEADTIKLRSYLDSLIDYKAFAETLPTLDAFVTHNKDQKVIVNVFPGIIQTDNDAVNDLLQTFYLFWTEMLKCQSKNLSIGLITQDWERYDLFIQRLENLLTDHTPTTFIDSHETIPSSSVPASNPAVAR